MTKTITHSATLKAMLAGAAISMTAIAATPAQAGALSFLKKAVKKELSRVAENTVESVLESAVETAADTTFRAEKPAQADAGQEGGGLWNSGSGTAAANPASKPMRQEGGTTVGTADDVQAPREEGTALIVPAVQPPREAARRTQRAKLKQTGTTVATASEVQAPRPSTMSGSGSGTARHRATIEPLASAAQFRKEGGTRVGTADEVQAPSRPQRAKLKQAGTTVATASEVQAPGQD